MFPLRKNLWSLLWQKANDCMKIPREGFRKRLRKNLERLEVVQNLSFSKEFHEEVCTNVHSATLE